MALCRLGVCRVCVMSLAATVFATATWLGGCARVLTNCLLSLMSTIFLILTAINSIL